MSTILEAPSSPVRADKTLGVGFAIPENRWDAQASQSMSPEELLLYRSNLLGSDLTVTNFGGGNTSAKLQAKDPITGQSVEVLWVKGSGGDIGSMKLDGFSTLYLDRLLSLEQLYRGVAFEDEMVGYLPHCTFNLNTRAASIDTPLHGYLPFAHVDHVHPDALIALAAAKGGQAATQQIWHGKVGWLDWKRPGFALGLQLRDYVAANPGLRGVMLAGHGIICWGEDAKSCYDNTIALIGDAAVHLNTKLKSAKAFGGPIKAPLPPDTRRKFAASLMPKLRGMMIGARSKIGHFCDSDEALEFVGSKDFERLAAIGTSCPDHFLRTKIAPLTLDPSLMDDQDYLDQKLESYRGDYKAYHQRWAGPDDPAMRDPNPIVVLVPTIGLFTFAADKTTARLASEFYTNAINVMRGAELLHGYIGLDEKEAFAIEYWRLEEAKLQRMPPPKPLQGKIALITGAAGGIGAAVARKLLSQGACVVLTDRDPKSLEAAKTALIKETGADVVRAVTCDVTHEDQVQAAFDFCATQFGGLDLFVANAGLASSAPIEETTLALWRQNYEVLAEGYFLTSRAAFPLLRQANGGSIVFIGSKNALSATPNASAYASAKAAAVHLARCLALEGAPHGIRVNVVNPDAVIKGSRIWDGDWRKERAGAYGIDAGEELEDFYRNRSLLKRHVLPEDVAEAVSFFTSEASSKSTGNIINVDAGNAQAFTR
jgi:rhamnulose-1-phosphate aldolase/alcohol dehydrogenase